MMDIKNELKVVYYAPKDIRVEPLGDIPQITDGELLVKVEACAICGSDIKTFLNGNPRMKTQNTIGHEFCGTIVQVSERAMGFRQGERITMATSMGCGECTYCKENKPNICKSIQAMGFHCNGAMASYVVIPAKAVQNGNVVKIGDLDAEIAALSEPMSCVINSLRFVDPQIVTSALIVGIGALGILHGIALKEMGIENIVCVSSPGPKRSIMEKLGFRVVGRDEIDSQYLELSGGDGFSLVIITAPSNSVQANALKYARKGGYISYFASLPMGDEMIQLNSRTLHYNELVLYGTSDSTADQVRKGIEIMSANKDAIKQIITKMPLAEFNKGVEDILSNKVAKVVLIP